MINFKNYKNFTKKVFELINIKIPRLTIEKYNNLLTKEWENSLSDWICHHIFDKFSELSIKIENYLVRNVNNWGESKIIQHFICVICKFLECYLKQRENVWITVSIYPLTTYVFKRLLFMKFSATVNIGRTNDGLLCLYACCPWLKNCNGNKIITIYNF